MAAISPLEWLGIAMATRAKEAGERAKAKSAEEQALVNERLTKYGGDIGAFQKEWEYGYGPQQTSSQQQAQQFYDFWMDLPKTLEGAQKEQKGLGSKPTLASVPPLDPAKMFADWTARQTDIARAWDSGVARAYEGARVQPPGTRPATTRSPATRARTLSSPQSRIVRF
jgi:hypothetical protein